MSDADLNKERLELALEAAGLDLWENNLLTGEVTRKASKTFEELGFTEEEIVEAVTAVRQQLIDMENMLRLRGEKENLDLEDAIWRSYGTLRFARQMASGEFMKHWSNLRLGAATGILPVTLATADELLTVAQDAHAKKFKYSNADLTSTDQARCVVIQAKLNAKEE